MQKPRSGNSKITIAGRVISDSFDGPTINTNRWTFTNGVTPETAGLFQTNGALNFTWGKRFESVKWSTTLSTSSDWSVLARVSLNVLPGFEPGGPMGLWNLYPRQLAALLGAAAPTNSGDLPGAFLAGTALDFRLDWRDLSGIVDDQKYLFVVNGFEPQIRDDHEFEFYPQAWLVLSYDSQRRILRPMVAPVSGEDPPPFSSFVEAYPPVTNITESSLDIYLQMLNGDSGQSNTLQDYATGEILDFRILPVAVPEPPVISSPATASGAVNGSFSYQITASGYPTSFSASGLPDGLSVNADTGLISGTPTSAGTNSVTVRATNEGGTGEKIVTITIRPVPIFAGPNSLRATVGQPWPSHQQVSISEFLSVRATNLPPGITLSTNGVLSGTPTTAGIYRPVLTATNTNGASTFQPNLVVQAAPPALPFTDGLATNTPGRYLKISGGAADLTFGAGRLNYSAPANNEGTGDANRVFFSPNVSLPLDSSWEVSVEVGLPRDRDAIDNAVGLALIPDQGSEDLSALPESWISLELGQNLASSLPETASFSRSITFGESGGIFSSAEDGFQAGAFVPNTAFYYNDAFPIIFDPGEVVPPTMSVYLDDQVAIGLINFDNLRYGTSFALSRSNGPLAYGKFAGGRVNLFTAYNYCGISDRNQGGGAPANAEKTSSQKVALKLRYSSVSKKLISEFAPTDDGIGLWLGQQTNSLDPAVADSLGQKFSLNDQSTLRVGLWAHVRTAEAYPTNRIWFSNLVVRTLAGPTLTALPASRTLTAGSALELTAPTGVGTFQYQWQKNRQDIEGATNATFTIDSVTAADAGNYTVRVSDDVASTTSSPCALSVQDGPQLTLVYPGARSTYVAGLFGTNIVGFYDGYPDEQGEVERHGFLYNGSNWTLVRPTTAVRSEARGISSNRIVGSFTDTNNRRRGYLLQNGTYTVLDYPSSTETRAFGVDGDRIVGEYRDANSIRRGFLRTGNAWTNLSFPGSVATSARGISGNRIVGRYTDGFGGTNGFILEGTNWTRLAYTNSIPSPEDPAQSWSPNYVDATSVSGNTVAGELNNGAGQTASFLYQGGAWQILSSSNLPVMITYGIQGNRLGGFYLESSETGNWLGVVLTLPAPEITLADSFSPVMGTAFSLPITAHNAPAGFSATNLPPGLSLDPTNGLISGTPTWSGGYLATITASNAAGVGSKNVTFNVEPQQLRISSQGSFTRQLTGPSGASNFEASGLPGGLTLSSSGRIAGTPTNTGYFTSTVTASGPSGSYTSQIVFTVFRTNLVVSGRIVSSANTPVANFPLRLVNPVINQRIFASATTGANGTFQLTAPADRNYQVVQANFTNANTRPTHLLYPVHAFADPIGTPVDLGDVPLVPLDRSIQVRLVDAFSREPVTGTNLTQMGSAALSCGYFFGSDNVAIWLLHQIQIRAQKSFWRLTPEERQGLREEATRLVQATTPQDGEPGSDSVEIAWGFLEGAESLDLPAVFQSERDQNENWAEMDYGAEVFRYLARTNASGLYEVPVALLADDVRTIPASSQSAFFDPTGIEFRIDAAEALRGKVMSIMAMVTELTPEGGEDSPGFASADPFPFDLRVRPAPRIVSGNFYRSNGTTPVTKGSVLLEQWFDYPARQVFFQECPVNANGAFQFAAPEDGADDWRMTGEERSDTQTNAYGYNYFISARQFLQIRSNNLTGIRLVSDQAPTITSIQGGAAGNSFRVNGSNLGCLGEVSLIPQPQPGGEVVTLPVFSELWTKARGAGFVEFGLPDYLPAGQYSIQYRYATYADNLVPDRWGFTTVTDTNTFTLSAATNLPGFIGYPGGLVRLPIRHASKDMWSLTLSPAEGEPRTLQARVITANYIELLLPEDLSFGQEWSLNLGLAQALGSLSLNDPTPVIELEPVDQAVIGGATANFAVGASGAQPLRYQWARNGTNLAGATNASLVISNAGSIHAGGYVAVVSNWSGSVTSAVATLSVQQPPRILAQPRGTNGIAGQSYTLTVEAEGSEPLTYQWRKGGNNLGAATNTSLVLNPLAGSDAGTYSVRISNAVGSVLSSNAVLTVVTPPQFAVQATNGLRATLGSSFRYDPIVTGSPAVFTLSNAPAGLSVNQTNGSITGTPTVPAYTRFAVVASNAAGTATLPLGLTVPAVPSALPFLDEFTSVPPTNRYMRLNLGNFALLVFSNQFTNKIIRYGSPRSDSNGAIAGWSPSLPISLTNSWEILLDVQMPNGWETPSAAVGMSLFPDSPTMTFEQFNPHRLHFRLDRDTTTDIPGNRFYRCSYASNAEFAGVPYQTNPTVESRGRLRFLYATNTRTLHTLYQAGTNTTWVALGNPADLNPSSPSSLAAAWGLSNGSSLRLFISGDSTGTNGSAGQAMNLDNLSVRSGQLPAIATQPRGTNVVAGGSNTFSASASGPDPYFYQWRLNGTNLAGATNAVLIRTNVQPGDAGNYSVVVSNLFGAVTSSNALLTVIAPPSFPAQATNGLRGNLGQAFSYQLNFSSVLGNLSASNLPPGLSLDPASGRITGTPTTAGYYRTTITASNLAGHARLTVAFTVPGARLALPLSDNFSAVTPNRYLPFNFYSPGAMRITNGVARFASPADGTNGSSAGLVLNLPLFLTNSWDVSADVSLPNGWATPEVEIGMSLDAMFGTNDTIETVIGRGQEVALVLNRDTEIEGSNNVRRSVYVGGEDQESLRTTITNDLVTNARLRFVYQTNSRSLRAWVQTNPALPWVAVGEPLDMNPATGGSLAQRWGLSNGSSLFLTLTAYAQGGTGERNITLDNLSMAAPVPPGITSTGSLVGQVGVSLAYTNRATNGPAEFTSTNLPEGLSLNPTSGVISGVPTAAGLTNMVVTARTPAGTAIRTNSVVILPAFLSADAVAGTANDVNFRHAVLVGTHNFGTNLRFSASNLPAGTAINATSGVISGRPTNAGSFASVVTITASGVSARQNIQFTFPAGQGAGLRLVLNPRPASVTNLPAGLTYVASTGVISGSPTVWGSFSATGRFANNTTTNIQIEILPSAPVITSPTNWVLQAGVEAQYQIVAGGVGREWAGYDDFSGSTSKWILSGSGGTTLLTSSGSLANRTTGSNSSQDGLAFWQRLLPRTANWEVWVKANLPTNAPLSGQNFKLGLLLGNPARNNGQVWEVRHFFGEGRYVAQHKRLNTLTDTNKQDVTLGAQPRAAYDLALKFTAGDQRLRGFVFDAEGNEVTNQVIALPAGLGSSLTPGIISECNRAPLAATLAFSADDFLILPDPGDIEYQAFLVDANGAALLDDGGQPYLPEGLFCNPNNGTVEGILAEDFPGGTYRMRVEAIYRPERLPGSSPPVVAGAATIQLRVIPAGQISMEFVSVENPGNPAFNAAGRGRVDYAYQIGKDKVTVGQYATFLNAAAQSESEGEPPLYSPAMATNANAGGILRLGANGSYRYQILSSPERPAAFVSWQAAARFCNWMVNGQGTNSILTGAYDFSANSSGHPSGSISKNSNATFRLPNGNEWFKAAYHDPTKAGTNKYWRYATRSDVRPGNSSLTTANQANFRSGGIYFLTRLAALDVSQNYLTDVGAFRASASYYGTFDQNGNLDEWIDQLGSGGNDSRLRWGGAWSDDSDAMMKSSDYLPASDNGIGSYGQSSHIGFRVVRNPPP